MVEHLHPNIDGYFIMADAIYDGLMAADILGTPGRAVDAGLARQEMPVTAIDRLAGDYRVARLKLDWPFKAIKEPYQPPPPADDIEQGWLRGVRRVAVTAGASAPELLVQQVVARLEQLAPDGAQIPATQARPTATQDPLEESTPTRSSRFLVPGGPNSEYGINQTDDYEIPAILRKQMD